MIFQPLTSKGYKVQHIFFSPTFQQNSTKHLENVQIFSKTGMKLNIPWGKSDPEEAAKTLSQVLSVFTVKVSWLMIDSTAGHSKKGVFQICARLQLWFECLMVK